MRPVTADSGATRIASETVPRGFCPMQEGGDSSSSNRGPEGTLNLQVLMRDVKHLNHIVALLRRCIDTTRDAVVHRDTHREGLTRM